MLTLANTAVNLGDRLFSLRAGAFGTVIRVGDSSGTLRVTREEGDRDLTFGQGGVVAGRQDVAWHRPLDLNLSKANLHKLAKLQAIVDAANAVI